MKVSGKWTRRAILWSAAGGLTVATIVAGSAAQAAHTTPSASIASKGSGYPSPKGIYKPFTRCPLLNPLMQESTPSSATGCVAGLATSGTIKIGNVTTKIKPGPKSKDPVVVQFGIWSPPNAGSNQFTGGILPPPGGLDAQLVSTGQYVPGGLLKALGCPSTHPTVERLCAEAKQKGGKYLNVYAAAVSAGPITNFQLLTWTQPVMFQLINPLLGNSCFIGSQDNPVVLNPVLSTTGTVSIGVDPNPTAHPDTEVLKIPDASATDTTFTAPGVAGCGPGGTANIAIDEAIDTSVGLPTASGADSIVLNGTFYLADCFAPKNMAKILLSAFEASASGKSTTRRVSIAQLRNEFGFKLGH
jgi:hypothetical protein